MSNQERYVAFLDILGFKKIVGNFSENIDYLGNLIQGNFKAALFSAMTGQPITVGISESERNSVLDESDTRVKHYIFSDSVIIYTEGKSLKDLEEIIRVLNIFVSKSLLEGFPIRGALVKGYVYAENSIIIGLPIIKAVKLEGDQEWCGIIIDESCFGTEDSQRMKIELMDKKLMCIENVLLKVGKCTTYGSISYDRSEHFVINWPEFIGSEILSERDLIERFTRYIGEGNVLDQQKK